ncbi:MAG TPA: U32 family peptidase [Moraxellaceae bacterium]|nr:U32 family peptidase [Moraxellaceae bacterium]
MKISIGPLLYFWSAERMRALYRRIAESPVDIVYLGESVCSKRREFRREDWLETADMLTQAGKEVVLSSLVLLEAESELGAMRGLCENGRFAVEANDIGVAYMAAELGVPFVGGHTLNIYNTRTLATWARLGMQRWLPPVELSREELSAILRDWPAEVPRPETEVFAYGRLPLAHSARCYTARARNLAKDQCNFACIEYPEGLPLYTQEQQGLFQINGIQTQSRQHCNLLNQRDDMAQRGVGIMRLSLSHEDDLARVEALREPLAGTPPLRVPLADTDSCNGYWFGQPGQVQLMDVELRF